MGGFGYACMSGGAMLSYVEEVLCTSDFRIRIVAITSGSVLNTDVESVTDNDNCCMLMSPAAPLAYRRAK